MKRSLGILSVAAISMLTLTGCPGGGGSSNSAVGVGNGQINSIPNESCNVQASYYTCTQTLNGQVMNTASIAFTTQQDFCTKLNDNYSTTNKDPIRGQVVATQTRQQLYTQRCQTTGNGGLPGLPGNPNQPTNGMKTFTCQLSVKKGNMIYEGQAQQLMMSQYLRKQTIPAMAIRTSGNGFFRISKWVSIANLNVEYSPALAANTVSSDQIKMSVTGIDGDISASVIGSANGETRIEIQPKDSEDGQTTLIASCVSAEAQAVMAPATSAMGYQCIGTETADGRTTKINYVNQISDVATSGISLTNALFVQGDQGSSVTFAQELPRSDDSIVSLKSKLTAATSVSVEKLGYSLKVKCQPK